METEYHIAVTGIGGVGGYLGGMLAARYSSSTAVRVAFIARGENERTIRSGGLTLITTRGEIKVHPWMVTDRPEEVGRVDLAVCCVKSYDLETSVTALRPCIGRDTVILPFLNGVDASERIRAIHPGAEVWQGCAYIVSRLTAPGVVKTSGDVRRFIFGADTGGGGGLERVRDMFASAGIDARVSDDIARAMWDKYFFISPFATLTAYLDLTVGDLLRSDRAVNLMRGLLAELKAVTDASHIALSGDVVEKTFTRMGALSPETTSSMHDDVRKGKRTEVDALTGYVVRLGKQLNIPTPNYEMMLAGLKKHSAGRKGEE